MGYHLLKTNHNHHIQHEIKLQISPLQAFDNFVLAGYQQVENRKWCIMVFKAKKHEDPAHEYKRSQSS